MSDLDLSSSLRQTQVLQSLQQVIEPGLNRDIVSLGLVRNLRLVDDYVYLQLYLGVHQTHLQDAVQLALSGLDWCKKSYIQVCQIAGVKHTLAISSGKGGVGKSTVAVNLAVALQRQGARVGLLDADIYGPNVPQMLGLGRTDVDVIDTDDGQRFLPLQAHGIQVMSVGLLTGADHPLVWRGPILHKVITQFLKQVQWGDLDFLLIDLPPGTGDAQITIVQESPICGALLVTTPQQVAIADVRRSLAMFRQAKIPLLGLVENMSYLLGEDGTPLSIFGQGGGQQLATEMQVPLLGQVPLTPAICLGGDTGRPIVLEEPMAIASQVFTQIATGLQATFLTPPSGI